MTSMKDRDTSLANHNGVMKILFVCQGNICRSPAAQGIFEHLVAQAGCSKDFIVDSAGTIGYHAGDLPDPRMRAHAARRGYELRHHARQIRTRDFGIFDLILTMDDYNYESVRDLAPDIDSQAKVKPMTDYCRNHVVDCVPDPYYGGASGFENVLDILEDACAGLLEVVHKSPCQ